MIINRLIEIEVINNSTNPLPAYETAGAAGLDVRANLMWISQSGHRHVDKFVVAKGKSLIIPTGLSVAIPEGFEIQVRSRSGLAAKVQVFVLNSPGTIDCDYRGEIKVILFNSGEEDFVVNHGDRIGQLVLAPVYKINWVTVDKLSTTDRGQGGLGHSGVK